MKNTLKKPVIDIEQDVSLYTVEGGGNDGCSIVINNSPGCGGNPVPPEPPGSSISTSLGVGGGALTIAYAIATIVI